MVMSRIRSYAKGTSEAYGGSFDDEDGAS